MARNFLIAGKFGVRSVPLEELLKPQRSRPMALVAMTVSDTVDYVSDLDPAKSKTQVPIDPEDPSKGTRDQEVIGEGATVFKLRPLDVFLMSWIYDNSSDLTGKQGSSEVGIKTRTNETNVLAVKHGLVGVTNFMDAKGQAVIFKTVRNFVNGTQYQIVDDSVLKALGLRLVTELATKLKEISDIMGPEEKNSV